jgi:hypothetical protein
MQRSVIIKSLMGILVLLCLVVMPGPACSPSEKLPVVVSTSPSSPIKVELSLSQAPKLGETVELTCTVNLKEPANNVTIQIDLPEGIDRVSGNITWNGNIPEAGTGKLKNWDNQVEKKVELKATIKAIKVGEWDIQAIAWYTLGLNYVEGDIKHIYLDVAADSAEMSRMPFEHPNVDIPGGSVAPFVLEVNLLISRAPALNETAEVTCIAKARPNPTFVGMRKTIPVTVRILWREGFDLVRGDETWTGDLPINTESRIEIKATIKAIKTGDLSIAGQAAQEYTTGASVGAAQYMHIQVGDNFAELGEKPYSPPQLPLSVGIRWASGKQLPLFGQPTEVTWILEGEHIPEMLNILAENTTEVTVEIELPPMAFTSVNGNPTWSGELPVQEDSTVAIKGTITAIKTGYWIILAHITQTDMQGNPVDSWETFGLGVATDQTTFQPAPSVPFGTSPPPPPYRWGPTASE